jgi:hypothetical protein
MTEIAPGTIGGVIYGGTVPITDGKVTEIIEMVFVDLVLPHLGGPLE